jgi:hypothetical protein
LFTGALTDINMLSINDYFTPESLNSEGTIDMLVGPTAESRKDFYLTNVNGDKLLKLSVKSEPHTGSQPSHAQIKIIGYGTKFAQLWADKPGDPRKVRFSGSVVELTYHGTPAGDRQPKVHLKAQTGYTTLIDDSLRLPTSTDVPVPLFASDCGYKNQQNTANPVKNKAHIVSIGTLGYVRVDFYLASANMDVSAFFSSMYFFNFFFTQDYLAAATNRELSGGQLIAPIVLLRMGDYLLIVRRSVSRHKGKPQLRFYSNKDYYNKFMNRPVARKGADGLMQWSTMAKRDERMRQERACSKALDLEVKNNSRW